MRDLHLVATGKTVKINGSVIRYQTPPTLNGNRVVYDMMKEHYEDAWYAFNVQHN